MKNDEIKIESKVPMPLKRGRRTYPFEKMRVGDSFSFTADNLQKVYQAASHYKRRSKKPWGYTCRKNGDGYRLWRIE